MVIRVNHLFTVSTREVDAQERWDSSEMITDAPVSKDQNQTWDLQKWHVASPQQII